MESAVLDLEEAALRLSEKDRAELARVLLLSLEPAAVGGNELEWAEEAERRYQELRSGASEAIQSEQVFAEARATRA